MGPARAATPATPRAHAEMIDTRTRCRYLASNVTSSEGFRWKMHQQHEGSGDGAPARPSSCSYFVAPQDDRSDGPDHEVGAPRVRRQGGHIRLTGSTVYPFVRPPLPEELPCRSRSTSTRSTRSRCRSSRWRRAIATPTTAATSTPTTAPATCSSSPAWATTPTSGSWTPTPPSASATIQHSVRMSDAISQDRLNQAVGPYRIEVIEPLAVDPPRVRRRRPRHRLRHDLDGLVPGGRGAPPRHAPGRQDHPRRVPLRAGRHVVGLAAGRRPGVHADRRRVVRHPGPLVGHPPGRRGRAARARRRPRATPTSGSGGSTCRCASTTTPSCSSPRRTATGTGSSTRPSGSTRRRPADEPEQLGWPRAEIRYAPGHPHPASAPRIHLHRARRHAARARGRDARRSPALNCGAGYGGDPDWGHGQWRGRDWIESGSVDHNDPADRRPGAVRRRRPRRHAPRIGDAVGYGMFEHGTFGRHLPRGFTDWVSVAD